MTINNNNEGANMNVELTISIAAWDDHVARLYEDGTHESGWAEPVEVKRNARTVRLLACVEAVKDLAEDADYQAEWGCDYDPKGKAMWRGVMKSISRQAKAGGWFASAEA